MAEFSCVWCDEKLAWNDKKGWVHASDGEIYKKNPDGSDNHCAIPKSDVNIPVTHLKDVEKSICSMEGHEVRTVPICLRCGKAIMEPENNG